MLVRLGRFPSRMPARSDDRHPPKTAGPAGATALVIIDMLSDWKFPDAEKLVGGALAVAPRIAALKGRLLHRRPPRRCPYLLLCHHPHQRRR